MDSDVTTLTSAMMRDDWWREELVKMDLPQLEDIISKLECEVVSVQSFIDSSKFTLEQDGMLSTFVARELEREHWAIEVDEMKTHLEYSRKCLQDCLTEEEQEDYETDIRAALKELEQLEPTLTLAKEMEKDAEMEMLTAQKKIQDAFELKCELESKLLKFSVDREILMAKQQLSSLPPYNYLSLKAYTSDNC